MNNTDKTKIQESIQDYLSSKYDETFSVKETYQEFDGNNGKYIRAVCSSSKYLDEFLVYLYSDKKNVGEELTIDGKCYFAVDGYIEVIFQNEILKNLGDYDKQKVYVGCKVEFAEQSISVEEYNTGIVNCIGKTDVQSFVKIYIVTDGSSEEELRANAENYVAKLSPYTGYVYYAVKDNFNAEEVETVFREKQHDFGNYLSNYEFASKVEFTLINRKDGIGERKVVKG